MTDAWTVARTPDGARRYALTLGEKTVLTVYVSPTGRSIRVYKPGLGELTADRAEAFDPITWIEEQPWKYARSMPDNPHWYVMVNATTSVPGFRSMQDLINADGWDQRWGKSTYRYLTIGEFDYWTMGSSKSSNVINRRAAAGATGTPADPGTVPGT